MGESKRVAFWVSKFFRRDFSTKLSVPLSFNVLPHIQRRLFSASEPRITTPGAPLGGGGEENESGSVADVAEDGGMRGAESAERRGEMAKEKLETAFDVGTGRREIIKETVVAGAEENVIDTTEYRSIIEDKSPSKMEF